jgi:hypothetical protein
MRLYDLAAGRVVATVDVQGKGKGKRINPPH